MQNDSHFLWIEMKGSYIQIELAEKVLKLCSKQPDVPAIY